MMKKIKILLVSVLVLICLTGCGESNHPCDWCGRTPTKEFKIDSDISSYVCKECRSKCYYCGKKATKHAPNYFDMEIFMCNDCYDEMK